MDKETRDAVIKSIRYNLALDEKMQASWYADEGYPAHLPDEVTTAIYWSIIGREWLLAELAKADATNE